MTALSKNVSRAVREGQYAIYGVQANATIYAGSLVEVNSDGHVKAAVTASSSRGRPVGVAEEAATGASTAGETKVRVRIRGDFHFAWGGTAGADDPGQLAYVMDDNTVKHAAGSSANTGELVGRIVDVDDDGVWVDISPAGGSSANI